MDDHDKIVEIVPDVICIPILLFIEFTETQNVSPDINVKNIDTKCVPFTGNLYLFITKILRVNMSREFASAK